MGTIPKTFLGVSFFQKLLPQPYFQLRQSFLLTRHCMSKTSLVKDRGNGCLVPSQIQTITSFISETSPDLYDNTLGERLNALPPEVLSEVFYWCVPTAEDQEYSSPQFALILSHVCRHWRFVTLNTPSLWTYTKVKLIQRQLSPALELLQLYLERSKTCPIFVDIDFVDIWMYYNPVSSLFQEIVDVVRRYRPANLLTSSHLETHLETKSSGAGSTRLEWYFWAAKRTATGVAPIAHSHDRGSSITLRALRIANGGFVLEPYLDWSSSLTFLEINDSNDYSGISVPTAISILAAFPLLVYCKLHIDCADTEPLQTTQVNLTNLQSLVLSWTERVDYNQLLDVLSAPALKELELIGCTCIPETIAGDTRMNLVRFLRRNLPPLKHLILDKIDCSRVSLSNALVYAPLLEGLWLENCILDDDFIRSMHTEGSSITESLITLVLISCHTIDLEGLANTLADIRTKRREEGSQPLVAYADECGVLLREQIERLEKMDVIELGGTYIPL